METDEDNYLSVVPRMEFDEDGRLIFLDMVPVELGFARERAYKGLPVCANAETARRMEMERKLYDHGLCVPELSEVGSLPDINGCNPRRR